MDSWLSFRRWRAFYHQYGCHHAPRIMPAVGLRRLRVLHLLLEVVVKVNKFKQPLLIVQLLPGTRQQASSGLLRRRPIIDR
eukprot:1230701-Amphidinium_carterae.1